MAYDPGWLEAQRRNTEERDIRASTDPAVAAQRQREADLLQRALINSPDYTAALRRAAVAAVDARPADPAAARRTAAQRAQARETAIAAEEARLSDVIEGRRREALAARQQQEAQSRQAMAIAACRAQAAQIDASMFDRRSILNLEGAIASRSFFDSCVANAMAGR
ncbi:MAG: hypothetical protein K2X11_00470 [Acetobacteraceae bacterium]|nr:hypothetical protein [Acetobacteraceae bacterium]